MAISEHLTQFAGRPVVDFDPEQGIADPRGTVYRVRVEYEEGEWTQRMQAFLEDASAWAIDALVIGAWGSELFTGGDDSSVAVNALVEGRDRLPNLRHLFLGDIVYTESEISWIPQSDVSPLWDAYPELETFCVRGAEDLRLGGLRHDNLRKLVVQSGGLGSHIISQVTSAELPRLEHLELWLGDDCYGGITSPDVLKPILDRELFPRLTYLGLCDSVIADEVAEAVAGAPVMEKIEVLDLSKGTLTDRGARALADAPQCRRLKLLDIHHHFVSEPLVQKLRGLGIDVNAEDRQEEDRDGEEVYRYVYASE